MSRQSKLAVSLCGFLRARTRHFCPNRAVYSRSLHTPAFSKVQASSWVPTHFLSTATSTGFIDTQATACKLELARHLVVKGVKAQKKVAWWLFGCSAWVFSMVVLGGVTRLTKSGLSMTDWKFMGSFPPISSEEWEAEFKKYKKSPEYKRVNKGMGMEDFKFIYWMEYAHRMWGRGLGLVFAGPFVYFLFKGFITKRLGFRLLLLLAMGAGQGFVGWWMVKSGLEEPESVYAQPKVSPYRLAGHLVSAFAIYSALLWTALTTLMPEPRMGSLDCVRGSAKLRSVALPIAALVGLTAASGAFVAGNDADLECFYRGKKNLSKFHASKEGQKEGKEKSSDVKVDKPKANSGVKIEERNAITESGHAFNTFPKMGDHWIPEGILSLQPVARNFFENTATVQFDHRVLATTTLVAITVMWLVSRRASLDPHIRTLVNATFGTSLLQVMLGVSTLILYVPVGLGVAHQAGALTLLTLVLTLLHSLRHPSPAALKALTSKISIGRQ